MVMINVYGSGITNYCLNPKSTSIAASLKLWDKADYILSDHLTANLMVVPKWIPDEADLSGSSAHLSSLWIRWCVPWECPCFPFFPTGKKKCPYKKIFESHFLQTADKQTYSMIIPKWFVSLCPEKDLKLGIPALTWGIQITWRMCMSPSISRVIGGPSEPNTPWKGLSGSFGRKVSLDSALHGLSSSLQVSGVHLLVLPERESGTLDYKKWPWHREWQPGLVTKEEEGIFSVTFTLSSTQPYLFPASWPQERHPLSGL